MLKSISIAHFSLFMLGLMFSAPFLWFYHYYPLPNFYDEWIAFAFGLVAMVPLCRAQAATMLGIPRLSLWLLAFLVVLYAQVLLGRITYPEQSLVGMLYVLWAAMLVWLGSELRREMGAGKVCAALASFLLIGGLLGAVAGVIQFYQIDTVFSPVVSRLSGNRAFGNLNQPNLFANYSALALGSLFYLVQSGRLRLAFAALFGALLLFILVLSGSRTVWLYLGWFVLWSLWCRWRTRDGAGLGLLPWAALASIIIYGVFLVAVNNLDFLSGGYAEDPASRLIEMSVYSGQVKSLDPIRAYIWHHAWMMFSREPWLGVGFAEFSGNFFQQAEAFAAYGIPGQDRNAHNIVLQLLAETGLIGALCVLGGLLAWAWRRRAGKLTLERWWIIALLGVEALHSMLEFPLWHAEFLGIAAVLLGLGEAAWFRPTLSRMVRLATVGILILGAGSLVTIFKSYRELELWLFTIPFQSVDTDPDTVVQRQNDALLGLHRTSLLVPYVELAFTATIVPDRTNLRDKLDLNGRVMHFAPIPAVAYRQVVLLALDGDREAALAQLRRAAIMYPHRVQGFLNDVERLSRRDPETYSGILAAIRSELKKSHF